MHLNIFHAIGGRGRGHFGGGRRDGGFGRGGFMGDRDDIPRGRKLSAADLQLLLLALLEERPAHGYELIRLLEERSGGFYAPSPGMIYPALTYLGEIDFASITQEGNRKQYAITDAGKAHLEANRQQAAAILETLARIGERMGDVREAFAGVSDIDPDAIDELHRARHDLKRALMSKRGSGPDEARRIARILARAAAEILGRKE